MSRVIFRVTMYEEEILTILKKANAPLSISEVKRALESILRSKISYGTVKRDLLALSAKGLVCSKSIGRGKRTTWVFWFSKERLLETPKLHEGIDPFSISLEERDSMSNEQLSRLYDILSRKYGHLTKKSRYVVLCDGKVVYSSNREPSDEEIRNLERRLGKVCYVLTRDPIEEASWNFIEDEDYYPTINLVIGNSEWTDRLVFDRGLRIVSDFDTGNPDISAFSYEDVDVIKTIKTKILRRAIHLERTYDYFLVSLKIGIEDLVGVRRCIKKDCRAVLYWTQPERNPFLLANPRRKGFVGRDLMIKFPFNISLSGREKLSKILLE